MSAHAEASKIEPADLHYPLEPTIRAMRLRPLAAAGSFGFVAPSSCRSFNDWGAYQAEEPAAPTPQAPSIGPIDVLSKVVLHTLKAGPLPTRLVFDRLLARHETPAPSKEGFDETIKYLTNNELLARNEHGDVALTEYARRALNVFDVV